MLHQLDRATLSSTAPHVAPPVYYNIKMEHEHLHADRKREQLCRGVNDENVTLEI